VDTRIIAATHQDLESLVVKNQFREDLFHRLNVVRIHLPRLADRREDIPKLMVHFLKLAAKELGSEPKILSIEAQRQLSMLPWEGNVRQLENVCRWITVMAPGREVHVDDLPSEFSSTTNMAKGVSISWEEQLKNWAKKELASGNDKLLSRATISFEKILVEVALEHTAGRKKDAAELLGWGRNTLTRKLKEFGDFDNKAD
jgi:two-component system nitrogen regulation response regulator GlnG